MVVVSAPPSAGIRVYNLAQRWASPVLLRDNGQLTWFFGFSLTRRVVDLLAPEQRSTKILDYQSISSVCASNSFSSRVRPHTLAWGTYYHFRPVKLSGEGNTQSPFSTGTTLRLSPWQYTTTLTTGWKNVSDLQGNEKPLTHTQTMTD